MDLLLWNIRKANFSSANGDSNSKGKTKPIGPTLPLSPSLPGRRTHIDGVPLKDPQLQEELQLYLPLLEELLHLGLGLVQLLQDALDVIDGAVVWRLVAGDGRVPAASARNTRWVNAFSLALFFYEKRRVGIGKNLFFFLCHRAA